MMTSRSRQGWGRTFLGPLKNLWPQVPLGAAVILAGVLNIVDGQSYPAIDLTGLEPLLELDSSLWALGSGSEVFLGGLLVLVGLGLLWRLSVAWSFAVLLMVITVLVNVLQEKWQTTLFLPGAMLVAAFAFRKRFDRRAVGANFLFSAATLGTVVAYGSFGTLLLGRGFHPKVPDLASAFYFTIVTISTVGYGDISPVTFESRLFVVSLIVVGLSIFATITASIVGPALSGELVRMFRPEEKKMTRKDHVILAGDGPLSRDAADELVSKGIPFTHVMAKGDEQEGDSKMNVVIIGNACEEAVLLRAGVKEARLVIAAREDDGENAFIALVSKDINPDISVLAVANSTAAIPRLKLARADMVFAPNAIGGRILVDLASGKSIEEDHQEFVDSTPI
ncbi:MAG: NAD-binding protein [Myxococcota bacterium]|nr:NAD-binding protein [Myxococcota bacterium]